MNDVSTKDFWDANYDRAPRGTAEGDPAPISWSAGVFLRRLLPAVAGKDVLELGCGTGPLVPFLAPVCRSVLGLDFSPPAIAEARRRCASFPNASFVQGDILEFDPGRKFDVITGSMFLHEILIERTPRLLDRLDGLLGPGGFLYFHENSFFNPVARFFRRRVVGKFGVPKHGSEHEQPFDGDRFTLFRARFRHCERFVEGVEAAQKVYEYLVPWKVDRIGRGFLAVDRVLSAVQARTGRLDDWSYTQSIYASQTLPREHALGSGRAPGNARSRGGRT